MKDKQKQTSKNGKAKQLLILFLTFLKIGVFTFGGGYAMIALLEKEFIDRKKWMEHDEFMDIVAIAESTPGPIAINCATYIGYKVGKFLGAVLATLAVCIPSFVIIFVISLFFNAFLEIKLVAYAFKGIQACVVFLILSAGMKMFIKMKKKPQNIVLFVLTFGVMLAFSLCAIAFSSIYYILIGCVTGLIIYIISFAVQRKKAKKQPDDGNAEDKEQ